MAKLDQLLARLRFESNPEPPVAADSRRRRSRKAILCVLLFVGFAPLAWSAVPAGYSAYIVPGDEDVMLYVLQTISGNDVDASEGMYSAISVTGWTDTTTVYYDHWEDGYEFDPFDPDTTADFIATVNKGTTYDFTSPAIPVPRSTEADCGDTSSPDPDCYYDGRDLIYTAGGGVVVTRGTWPVEIDGVSGVVIAFAWEVYPVRPFLEQYTAPFGEDLVASDGYNTFEDVYALVQATEDNTEIFLNGASQGTYDKGDVWLHEDMQTGDVHSGSAPLQIQYIAADPGGNYEVRGFSSYPDTLWDRSYYAPVDGPNGGPPNNLYLFNPHATALDIVWEDSTGTNNFSIPAGSTISYFDGTGQNGGTSHTVPNDSGVHLTGADVFWGVSVTDDEDDTWDWGHALVPQSLLQDEYFLGWTPGGEDAGGDGTPDENSSPIWITAVEDGTQIIVDVDGDGAPETTLNLDRLESIKYYSPINNDLTGARLRSNRPIAVAYGEDPDVASTASPGIDLGFTNLPSIDDWLDLVLTVDKQVSPEILDAGTGQIATFSFTVRSFAFDVEDLLVEDLLPTGWQYVPNTTTIIMPDNSVIGQPLSEPSVLNGQQCEDTTIVNCQLLTWGRGQAFDTDMDVYKSLVVTFDAIATGSFAAGDLSLNNVIATGLRTLTSISGASRQDTFKSSDNVFYSYNDMEIDKSSSAGAGMTWGETVTYTVVVTNPATAAATLQDISIVDNIPDGVSYVASSGEVTAPAGATSGDHLDLFNTVSYNNSNGSLDWSTFSWIETGDNGLPDCGSSPSLCIGTRGPVAYSLRLTATSASIMRQADTSGATQVTLNFDYIRRFLTSATEYATADVCEDWNGLICATGWIEVGRFQGPANDAAYQPFSLDLNTVPGLNPISSTFALRFTSNNLVPPRPPISVNIDNIQLVLTGSGGGTVTNPSNDPPFFVEVADDYDLAPGEQLTLTYDVLVDDPLAVNLFDVTNTAEVRSTSLLIPSIDSVTDDVPITVVGDTVWYDLDDDGVVDVGEPGIPNVQVNLLDSGGAVVATTTTASNGTYRFDLNGLPAGDYEVEAVNPPAGLVPSTIATNPTGLFTVAEGDTYLDADIGFRPAPGTAIIGNQVWSDANFDGFRDPGEIGIGGVTIELRRQSDGALIATATTAPDGSYLFTGLAADDYYVDVLDHDPGTGGSGPLNGYALVIGGQSNVDPTLPITVVAGDVYLYADFGFYNALLHTVGDTVWYDADGDAFRDDPVSEPGIEGVSVDLLDSLGNVIGTTFTAADGTFTFDGVPDGTYEYRIPHGTGILTGYTPTTPDAIASGRTIVVAGADVIDIDDFGYTLYGAIGDTVFSDANANRVQDPGEVGIGGVTVELFRDQNANGILDIGDGAAIETTTTDSSGRYLFTRRPAAVYFVSVNDGQAALTGYIPTTIDEEAWPGTQLVAVLPTGTSSFLEADFGYQDPTLLDISGTVWHDEHDPPGSIDPGEVGISTVTIELLDPNGVMVASTTTDASGNYLFPNVANLPVGQQYTVQVTDIFGVLIGMVSTTGGDNQPADPGDTNINFGYRRPGKVTLASISEFRVISDGTTSVVEWITRTELGTMGFLLERYDSTSNEWRRVNNKLVPALIASPQGGVYRHPDGEVTLGATHTYRLVEEEIWDSTRVHGPFEVEVAPSAGETLSNLFEAQAHQPEPHRYVMRYAMDSPPGTRAKIILRKAGLTHLDATTIADALEDVDEAGVVEWIAQGQLRLSHREQEVAWKADADGQGVSFIAEAIDSLYTLDNVYWAEPGQGTVMEEVLNSLIFTDDFENGSVSAWSSGKSGSSGSNQNAAGVDSLSFSDSIKYEEDVFPATLVATDPESDYWYWKGMIGGHPTLGTVSVSIEVPTPVTGDSNGQLLVRLHGINDTPEVDDHRVAVWINGEYAGQGIGHGAGGFSFAVNIPSTLNDGANEVQLVAHLDHAGPSYLYMDSLELTYLRGHRAADDVLEIGIEESGLVTVDGFTSDEITVINTSDPEALKVIGSPQVRTGLAGDYRVSFEAEVGESYLLTGASAMKTPVSVAGRVPGGLADPGFQAELLVIAPHELESSATEYVAQRSASGVVARLALLEDIYDEFNHGIANPHAIKDMVSQILQNTFTPPRWVVLLGKGTWDYRDLGGVGDCLVPTLFTATPYGLYASDGLLTDVDGDGMPEIPVGRVPVITETELDVYLGKLGAYESATGPWREQILMLADDPDPDGGDFPRDSDILSTMIPQSFVATNVYLSDHSLMAARQLTQGKLYKGVWWTNFGGHGGLQTMTDEGLFVLADVEGLGNGEKLSVLSALSCTINRFTVPAQVSLGEALTLESTGGAIAVWAPTGMSSNFEAMGMNVSLFEQLFDGVEPRLGDIVQATLNGAEQGLEPEERFMLRVYNLIGDPSTVVR